MARLKLVYDPNPILRAKNADMNFPLSFENRELIDQMIFACKKFHGVGLAAPQIGKNLNLAIINLSEYDLPAFPIINPRIVSSSANAVDMEEGCLSIPDKFAQVKRPEKVTVEFFNEVGKKVEIDLDGFIAKVFQHEIDHLSGKLIRDKWNASTLHTVTEIEKDRIKKSRKQTFKRASLSK